ncbi:hypothetical protein T492DRAFT_861892 [Pavlovales sp. CCMP2436]|nr:hypothetical protein T492DRAFT_861892 [Pavlovales sp. CCMP2436]
MGRKYSSVQNYKRPIRAFLFAGIYDEFDVKSCQLTIMLTWAARSYNLALPALRHYVSRRAECARVVGDTTIWLGADRTDFAALTKSLILRLTFGGNYDTFEKEQNCKLSGAGLVMVHGIEDDVTHLMQAFKEDAELYKYYKAADSKPFESDAKQLRRLFALRLQDAEFLSISAGERFISESGYTTGFRVHDALYIEKVADAEEGLHVCQLLATAANAELDSIFPPAYEHEATPLSFSLVVLEEPTSLADYVLQVTGFPLDMIDERASPIKQGDDMAFMVGFCKAHAQQLGLTSAVRVFAAKMEFDSPGVNIKWGKSLCGAWSWGSYHSALRIHARNFNGEMWLGNNPNNREIALADKVYDWLSDTAREYTYQFWRLLPTSLSTFKLVLADAQGTPVSTAGLAQDWDVHISLTKGGKVANSGLYRFAPGASGSLGNMYTVLRPYARKFANAYAQDVEVSAVKSTTADVNDLVVRNKTVLSNNVCTASSTADGTEAVAYFNFASLANRATPNGSSDAYSTGSYTIPVLSYPLNPIDYDSATCFLQDSTGLLVSSALSGLAIQFDYTFGMKGCVVTIGDPNIPATPTATIQRAYAVSMGYSTAYQSLVPFGGAQVILQAFGPVSPTANPYTESTQWTIPLDTPKGALITVVIEGLEPVCYVGFALMERMVVIEAGQRDNWPLTQLYAPAKAGVLCRLGAVPASTRGANSQNMRPCMFNQLRVRTTGKNGARLTPALVFASEHASRFAPDVLLGGKAEMGGELVVRGAATFGAEALFNGRAEVANTLYVQGDASFDAAVQVTGKATFNGSVYLSTLTYMNNSLLKAPVSINITGCTASDSWLVQTDNIGSEFQNSSTHFAFNKNTPNNWGSNFGTYTTAGVGSSWVQIMYPHAVTIKSFTITYGTQLREFTLSGSTGGSVFTTVQTYARTMTYGVEAFTVTAVHPPFQYWRLTVTLTTGGNNTYTSVGEWELLSSRGLISLVSAQPTSLSTFKLVLADAQGTPVSTAGLAQDWDVHICLTKGGQVANSGLYRFAPGRRRVAAAELRLQATAELATANRKLKATRTAAAIAANWSNASAQGDIKKKRMPMLNSDKYEEVNIPRLAQWDSSTAKLDGTVIAIGKRRTGKSFAFRHILHSLAEYFPAGLCISQTDELNKYWRQYMPSKYIFSKFDPEILHAIAAVLDTSFTAQQARIAEMSKSQGKDAANASQLLTPLNMAGDIIVGGIGGTLADLFAKTPQERARAMLEWVPLVVRRVLVADDVQQGSGTSAVEFTSSRRRRRTGGVPSGEPSSGDPTGVIGTSSSSSSSSLGGALKEVGKGGTGLWPKLWPKEVGEGGTGLRVAGGGETGEDTSENGVRQGEQLFGGRAVSRGESGSGEGGERQGERRVGGRAVRGGEVRFSSLGSGAGGRLGTPSFSGVGGMSGSVAGGACCFCLLLLLLLRRGAGVLGLRHWVDRAEDEAAALLDMSPRARGA